MKLNDEDIMPFGKYRNQLLKDIPDDYWVWFLRQSWCDAYPELVEYANLVIEDEG